MPRYLESSYDIHLNETETVLVELLMQNEGKIKYWNRLGYRQRKN